MRDYATIEVYNIEISNRKETKVLRVDFSDNTKIVIEAKTMPIEEWELVGCTLAEVEALIKERFRKVPYKRNEV